MNVAETTLAASCEQDLFAVDIEISDNGLCIFVGDDGAHRYVHEDILAALAVAVAGAAVLSAFGKKFPGVAVFDQGVDVAVGNDIDAAAATTVAGRTYELTEFLVDVLKVTDVGAYFPHRVTYHPTCHSVRITKVGDRPLQLLRAVHGIDLVELPKAEQCCGFGGTFSIKNPDVSVAMASDKARHVRSTDAEYLVAGDQACLMNIGGVLHRQRSGIKTIHIAEILASTEKEVTVA